MLTDCCCSLCSEVMTKVVQMDSKFGQLDIPLSVRCQGMVVQCCINSCGCVRQVVTPIYVAYFSCGVGEFPNIRNNIKYT